MRGCHGGVVDCLQGPCPSLFSYEDPGHEGDNSSHIVLIQNRRKEEKHILKVQINKMSLEGKYPAQLNKFEH